MQTRPYELSDTKLQVLSYLLWMNTQTLYMESHDYIIY